MATKITADQQKQLAEDHEKATLLKESLKIVDELAKIDYDFYQDGDEVEKLIDRAQKLRKHRLWKLK
jgi:hypothetical protein